MYEINDSLNESRNALLLNKFELLQQGKKVKFKVNDFTQLINYLIESQDFQKAFLVLVQAINLYPDNYKIQLAEIQVLIESSLNIAALKKLKVLYKTNKNDIGLLMLAGINFVKLAFFNKAVKIFDRVVNLVKNDKDFLLYNISQIFIDAENYLIAAKYLEKAHEINYEDESIILDLAFCYDRINEFAKAEKLFVKYLSIEPFSELAWFNYGVVLMEQKKIEKAMEAFDFSTAIAPEFASPIFNKAQLLLKLHNYKDSIVLFSKFITIEPNNASAFYFKAKAEFHSKKYILALKDLKQCLKIDKNNGYAWYLTAKIYFVLRKKLQAKKAISLALSIDKKNQKFIKFASNIIV